MVTENEPLNLPDDAADLSESSSSADESTNDLDAALDNLALGDDTTGEPGEKVNFYDDVDELLQALPNEDAAQNSGITPLDDDKDDDDEIKPDEPGADKKEGEKDTPEKSDRVLTPEEEALAKELKKIGIKDGRLKVEAARTEAQFLDATHPISQLLDKLKTKSASRYTEAANEIVAREIADPLAFAQKAYALDPEKYGEFLNINVGNYPDVVADRLRAAGYRVEKAGEFNPNAVAELEGDADWDDVKKWYPKLAETIEKKLGTAPPTDSTLPDGEKEEQSSTAAKNETPEQIQMRETVEIAQRETFAHGFNQIQEHLETRIAKDFGLSISDKEWETRPALAAVKQSIIDVLLEGSERDKIPGFGAGLFSYAGEREDFVKADKNFRHFVTARERENAAKAAGELIPIADSYLTERTKLPAVRQRLQAAKDLQDFYAAKRRQQHGYDNYIPPGSVGKTTNGKGSSSAGANKNAHYEDDL